MGVQFGELDARYGAIIDEMVRGFVGLTVLVVAASPERLSLLGRYVRSIITCEIVEATQAAVAEVALEQNPDLVVIDLDVNPEMGLRTIAKAKTRAANIEHRTPVVLLAGAPELRARGISVGADEALATPPSFHELQAAVIRMLSRPVAIR
jgi:DNA-binding response OmpR family regulator